jgi:hypothetical protein
VVLGIRGRGVLEQKTMDQMKIRRRKAAVAVAVRKVTNKNTQGTRAKREQDGGLGSKKEHRNTELQGYKGL